MSVLHYREVDVVKEVKLLTGGGADVAIEALGTQDTFQKCLECLRPGWNAFRSWDVFRETRGVVRGICRWTWGLPDADNLMSWWKGAYATAHGGGEERSVRSHAVTDAFRFLA